jgi:hypothetical protein
MRRRLNQVIWLAAAFTLWSGVSFAQPRWSIDFENGGAFTGYNDVRIPGDTGTLISLTDDLRTQSTYFWRVRVDYRLARKHILSALAAPLTLNASGTVAGPVNFNGYIFPARVPLRAGYQFNSYRVTWRYEFVQDARWTFGLGLTAKLRDAYTRLEGPGLTSTKSNVGFVPLVNFKLQRTLNDRVALLVEGDALAAPQGRAEDVLAALKIGLGPNASLKVGYRLLEGGADVAEVYTFTLVHYLAIGATIQF